MKQAIWNAAQETIQEWTGQELTPCSLYGIRIYREGSVLATHVDRLPLVSSAIINVAQDVDEPWYVENTAGCFHFVFLLLSQSFEKTGHLKYTATTEKQSMSQWNQVIWSCMSHTVFCMDDLFP